MWIRVYNDTGSTISNGKVCYLSGVQGAFPTVGLAKADAAATCLSTLGLATHDIETGTYGYITNSGLVRGLNTSSGSSGDRIYLSATTAGDWTITAPDSPNYLITLGNIIVDDASVGSVQVSLSIGNNTRDVIKVFNGAILESHDTTITSDGATITLSIEKTGGGDLSLFYNGIFYNYDSTPAATVSLTAGTDTVPVLNYVFIPEDTKAMTANTTGFDTTQQIVHVATVVCQSAASVQTDGVFKHHAWTDHLANNVDQGHMVELNEWIRNQPATWLSGCAMTPTLGASTYDVATGSGSMLQLHRHSIDAFDTSVSSNVYVVNNNATPYAKVGDLTGQTSDSTGASLSGKHFSFVFWISGNEGSGNDKLYCNLPDGSYNTSAQAILDAQEYSNYTIPTDFKGTGILIARVTAGLSGTTWTLHETEDLRGLIPQRGAGGTGSSVDPDAIHDNVAGEIAALNLVTAASGDHVLIEDASDSNNKKRVAASDFLSGGGGGMSWSAISTNTNAVKDNGYIIDASSGAVTLTLPSSPSVGDSVGYRVTDVTNKVTIGRNGSNIETVAQDYWVLNVDSGAIFTYQGATEGWVVTSDFGFREISADTSIYCATTGSDSTGDGSSGLPFYSPAKCMELLNKFIIVGDTEATIDIANGSYTGLSTVTIEHANADRIIFLGDAGTPSNVSLTFTSGQSAFYVDAVRLNQINGLKCTTSNVNCISITNSGDAAIYNVELQGNDTNSGISVSNKSECLISASRIDDYANGFFITSESQLDVESSLTVDSCPTYGVYGQVGSQITINNSPTITNCGIGICTYYHSRMYLISEGSFSGNTTNSSPAATTGPGPTYGNTGSYIIKQA
jgi:hypothetical protein